MTDSDRWIDSGAISFEQAERLDGDAAPETPGGPRTVEVLGYMAAFALFIATVAAVIKVSLPDDPLIGLLTDFDNLIGGVVALVGAAIVFGAGYVFADAAGAIKRAGGFLMLVGFALATLAFNLLLFDLDLKDLNDARPLIVLVPSALVAFVAWQKMRSVPTQLALFSVAVSAVSAVLILIQVADAPPDLAESLIATGLGGAPATDVDWISQLAYVGLGLGWMWFTRTGYIRPRNTGFAVGAAYAWVYAVMLFSSADGWIVLSIGLAAVYFYGAADHRSSVLAGFAGVATTALILQVMTIVYEEAPGTTEFMLWYGIPGLAALAAAWVLGPGKKEASGPVSAPPEGE